MATAPFVLVAGNWLGGWAWQRVADVLADAGHPVDALTLPGLGSASADRGSVRLADHVDAASAAVERAGPSTVLVAHSGGGKIVTGVLDRAPASVRRVVYVDSGPASEGWADELPEDLVELPLPPWDQLEASLDGLTDDDLARFREGALPHPAAVLREPLRLANPARHAVPSTLVCCSFPSATILELAAAGHPMFAPVTALTDLTCVDLPTGHWPMWSRPAELAEVLLAAAAPEH
jgi:pimeloyl-ACP methyl ester carboxylesterase